MQKSDDNKESAPPPQYRSIQEQRIDFLLEEEFACNIDFLRSFVAQCGLACEPQLLPEKVLHESRHGSTWIDLLVIFEAIGPKQEDVRVALLVEDKITAPPQPDQAERYKNVGHAGLGTLWDEFRTVLVAPHAYQGEKGKFQAFVALEDVAVWLSPHDPIRADFRRDRIAAAIEKKNKSGVQNPDLAMTEFKNRYYDYIQKFNLEHGTDFFMKPPKNAYDSDDTWFTFSSGSLPQWCEFRHRIRTTAVAKTGLVEIAFKDTSLSKAETVLQPLPDLTMRLFSNGKYYQHVAVEIKVPEIPGVPIFDSVADKVELALTAAARLWRHVRDRWSSLEPILLEARAK